MTKEFIPMSRPLIGEEEIDSVIEVMKSGWITTGSRCREFEDKFAELTGAKHALALTSGTAGMQMMLMALDIKKGDEVITPSMTFASTVNQIVLAGGKPVFADIDYDTMLVKPEDIKNLITPKTKAIIPVHFAGAPADMDSIEAAAGKIPVIEDAAHAIDTRYRNKHIGYKNPAVFSFHPIKNITTGEGGMITGNDERIMHRLRLLRFHGIERDAWKRYGKASDPCYDIAEPGFKYNMTDIQAAIGLAQMKRLNTITHKRNEIASQYIQGLSGIEGLDIPGVPGFEHNHSWHLFVVKVKSIRREDFMKGMAEKNLGYGLHFPPCHTLSYIKSRFGLKKLPVTDYLADKIVSLPLYPGMDEVKVQRVIDVVRTLLN